MKSIQKEIVKTGRPQMFKCNEVVKVRNGYYSRSAYEGQLGTVIHCYRTGPKVGNSYIMYIVQFGDRAVRKFLATQLMWQ